MSQLWIFFFHTSILSQLPAKGVGDCKRSQAVRLLNHVSMLLPVRDKYGLFNLFRRSIRISESEGSMAWNWSVGDPEQLFEVLLHGLQVSGSISADDSTLLDGVLDVRVLGVAELLGVIELFGVSRNFVKKIIWLLCEFHLAKTARLARLLLSMRGQGIQVEYFGYFRKNKFRFLLWQPLVFSHTLRFVLPLCKLDNHLLQCGLLDTFKRFVLQLHLDEVH